MEDNNMDEVLEQLESTIITPETTEEDQDTNNYQRLYKYWGRLGNQEERRREILETQKINRNDRIDSFRGILNAVRIVEERNIFKPYNRVHYRPSIYVAGFHRAPANYNNLLMLSEWMIEKPIDLSEKWYIVPCPKGTRMLVVAHQGMTRCFTKFGHLRKEFRSALPGGNPSDNYKNRTCVLDCFYSDENKIMYILDLLAWNNQPMTDGETEFRQYWLKSKLTEYPDLMTVNRKNNIVFQILPMIPCTPDALNKFMMIHPHFPNNVPKIDGLLFYHKEAHYVSGETPLVGWLFPFMVQEVLGSEITVHPEYVVKPPGYENQAQFIKVFEEKIDKRRPKSKRRSNMFMETTESVTSGSKDSSIAEPKNEEVPQAAEVMEADRNAGPSSEDMDQASTSSDKQG